MKLSSRAHGVLDYVVGLGLILSPRIFGLDTSIAEGKVPMMLGWAALIYSLLTRYELGLLKVLPFRAHLALDVMSGAFLAASPWLFWFADRVWVPHVVIGLFEAAAVVMTRKPAHETHTIPGAPAH